MKVTLEQLKKLLSTYRLKVVRIQPMEHGFFIDTNKGRKALTIWEDAELLKWSNQWREELAAQGEPDRVECFLVNFNKKKYIRYQGKFYVLSNAPAGRTADFTQKSECIQAGQWFAKFHLASTRTDRAQFSLVSHTSYNDQFFADGHSMIKDILQGIEGRQNPSLMDELIYRNLAHIYKRFCRAIQLWEGVQDSIAYFPISLTSFSSGQIAWNENGWFVSGGYNQPLGPIHQDTVHLLRQVFEQSSWDITAVTAFLQGYEANRKLTENEWVYILAQLTVPFEVWPYITAYSKQNGDLTEAQAELFTEAIRRQKYWDELTLQIAKKIDENNVATA